MKYMYPNAHAEAADIMIIGMEVIIIKTPPVMRLLLTRQPPSILSRPTTNMMIPTIADAP
jgi:hypothetical protein